MAHFEVCAAVTTCNSGSCLFSRLPSCFPTHHRNASPEHLHTPSAVSSDEGPYSKGSKESGTTDQSHPSHRRSFSGTMPSKLTPCKSVLLLLPDSCYTAQLVYVLTKRSHTVWREFCLFPPACMQGCFFFFWCVLLNVALFWMLG